MESGMIGERVRALVPVYRDIPKKSILGKSLEVYQEWQNGTVKDRTQGTYGIIYLVAMDTGAYTWFSPSSLRRLTDTT